MVINLDDFKPPSVDTSRTAEVQIGSTNECTVTIPNVHVRIFCVYYLVRLVNFILQQILLGLYNIFDVVIWNVKNF